ncbi:hypothetical protein OCHUTO_1115 [Orientia chuto str. Dubai]|uniref:Uncharacterized protein n=1 Tax=Orientia chuto str. Dubai TaxID=1359168 RepID=A0A0F3MG41_9RICK|nr:hypothetical protein [Candidatus Orientia mediorientalis]KJV54611.1 hypothetical protein OCHUTO_1115 [Orientia chuto str. Dubai]
MYSVSSQQLSTPSNRNNSAEIVRLADSFISKKCGNNTLILIGWDDDTYFNMYTQISNSHRTRGQSVNYYMLSGKSIVLEYLNHRPQERDNTLYTVEEFNYNQLMGIVVKHDKEYIDPPQAKSFENKSLTVVSNNLAEDVTEQIQTFTQDDRISYYSNNINIFNDVDGFQREFASELGLAIVSYE